MCGLSVPLRPRRNPNEKAVRSTPPEGKERRELEAKQKRLGSSKASLEIYFVFLADNNDFAREIKKNEFAAGKLNIDSGGGICQEARASLPALYNF
jgi:hypothetical protein